MSYLKIARMGHPVLRKKASPVTQIGETALWTLIQDMYLTMLDARGVGLAAPQVHHSLRLLVWLKDPETAAREDTLTLEQIASRTLINPILEPIDDQIETDWEGCLSIPGLRGLVPRYRQIAYRGFKPDNTEVEDVCDGLAARILQHEVDHLDGILYIDRMPDLRSLVFEEHLSAYHSAENKE